MPSTDALVVTMLKTIRDRDGHDAAMTAARRMILAAASILGHEFGADEARDALLDALNCQEALAGDPQGQLPLHPPYRER